MSESDKEQAKRKKEEAKRQKEEAKIRKEEEKRKQKQLKEYANKFEKLKYKCPSCGKSINIRKRHGKLKKVGYYDPKKDHFMTLCEMCKYTFTLCDKCIFSDTVAYEFPCPICEGITKCLPEDKVKLR